MNILVGFVTLILLVAILVITVHNERQVDQIRYLQERTDTRVRIQNLKRQGRTGEARRLALSFLKRNKRWAKEASFMTLAEEFGTDEEGRYV